nr:spore coat protein CotJB [Clostridium sp. cel8]
MKNNKNNSDMKCKKDGKKESQKTLLQNIRQLEFASLDLNLYLDNFPDNKEALTAFNNCYKELNSSIKKYEKYYGPLLNFGFSQGNYPWNWINSPWPWESQK